MFINKAGELKVRVRGVDAVIRELAETSIQAKKGAQKGTVEAADYLKEVIEEKIGTYQDGWARLKPDTIFKKIKRYGVGDRPLLASGALKSSFYVIPGGKGTISATVSSKDPKLPYHVGGAPKKNVPKRDPMMSTAKEEADMCHDIIEDAIYKAIGR